MGAYTSIRGWIEVHDKSLGEIRNILTDHEVRAEEFGLTGDGARFYNEGWIIPEDHINWTHYIFFGADIRTQYVEFIRSEMTAIAELFMTDDAIDDEWGIYPTGMIHTHEDGTFGYPDELWKLESGKIVFIKSENEHGSIDS